MSIFDKIYEDSDGIKYELIGFEDNQYKLKVIESSYPTINVGVTEKRTTLPPKSNKLETHG